MWLDLRRVQYIAQADDVARPQEIFDHYGPYLDPIPIEDILVPSNAREVNGPNRCQFIDHVSQLRWDELKAREEIGYENIDAIKDLAYTEWGFQIKSERDRLRGIEKIRRDGEFDIHEVWCLFPTHELKRFPGKKVRTTKGNINRDFVELVITYHKSSRTVLRIMENWNEIGIRPFFNLPYVDDPGSVYGIGVGSMIHQLNEAINTVHNQRVDNATVGNTRMWAVRKGVLPRGTQMVPSKILHFDNPKDDIIPLQCGEVYPSSFSNETALKHYAELRTGVTDYQMGREAQGQYQATATSTMQLLEQGNIRWDFTLDDWRNSWAEVAMWLLSQYRQYGYHYAGILEREFGEEKAARIREALELQSDQPTFALYKFDLVASTAADSKEAELAKSQMLFELTERFYGGILSLLGTATRGITDEGLPVTQTEKELIYEAVEAGMALYRRILHSLDIKDVDSYMPNPDELLAASQQDEVLRSAGAYTPPAPPVQGTAGNRGGAGASRKPSGSSNTSKSASSR
jgi:hypothetical protein